MDFIAWVALVWGGLMILLAFGTPAQIGKPRTPYTPAVAATGMAINIAMGAAILAVSIAYLTGGN